MGRANYGERSLHQMAGNVVEILNRFSESCYINQTESSFRIGGASMGKNVSRSPRCCRQVYKAASMLLLCIMPGCSPPPYPITLTARRFLNSFSNYSVDPEACVEHFFAAIGEDFVRRPGLIKFKEKLIQIFFPSTKNFSIPAEIGMAANSRCCLSTLMPLPTCHRLTKKFVLWLFTGTKTTWLASSMLFSCKIY